MRAAVRIEGYREVRERLDDIGTRARRPEQGMRSRSVVAALRAGEARRFNRRINPAASRQWVARKRRQGLDPRTLRATGRLERALTMTGGSARVTAYNGELRWGLPGSEPSSKYAAILAAERRSWRVVVIDVPARKAVSDHILRYIITGDAT